MELKQQVTLSLEETKNAIAEHLARKGIIINMGTMKIEQGGVFALTMTEEEIWLQDTQKILLKPLSSIDLKDKKLKEKILKKFSTEARVHYLLNKPLENMTMPKSKERFMFDQFLNPKLFEDSSSRKKDKLTLKDQKTLLAMFADLGIILPEMAF